MNIEELAEQAYVVYSTECFRVGPERLPKPRKGDSGTPRQTHGVMWEQLPDMAKATWRKVVTVILENKNVSETNLSTGLSNQSANVSGGDTGIVRTDRRPSSQVSEKRAAKTHAERYARR